MRSLPVPRFFAPFCLLMGSVALAGIALLLFVRSQTAPVPPQVIALWYWHRPLKIPPSEAVVLQTMGVRELFVRAATITREADNAVLIVALPQIWKPAPPKPPAVHLVFRVDDAVTRRFATQSIPDLAAAITAAFRSQRALAGEAGFRVVGVQIDLDCPTRLLPQYAALLRAIRPALRSANGQPALSLSISALASWYNSRPMAELLDAVDFAAPQFYEGTTPRTRAGFLPISDDAALARGLRAAGRSGHPFYAGLPAYGHALVYDGHGVLRGAFHDAGAADILRNPDFRLIRTFASDAGGNPAQTAASAVGEQIVEFSGAHPDTDNYRLVFDLPTPQLVERALAHLRADTPPNCLGAILFRYPQPGEGVTLPLPTLAASVRGEPVTAPTLKLGLRTRRHAPWTVIEAGPAAETPGTDLFVDVTALGAFGTTVAPDAAVLTLRFPTPGRLLAVSPGGFDTISVTSDGAASSLARADSVRLGIGYLAPGKTVTVGPIRLSDAQAATVHASWQTVAPGNTITAHGDETVPLNESTTTR